MIVSLGRFLRFQNVFLKCLDVLIVLNALFTIKIMLIEDIKADIEEWPHVKKKSGKATTCSDR